MATTPVTLDFGKAIAIGDPADAQASALQGAIAYGSTQDPDAYAGLLKLQKQTGVPPAVSSGNQQQVRQAAEVNAIDYRGFAVSHPRTTAWASNPDNAAVSGADEVQRLAGIEGNAGVMRAATPWEAFSNKYLYPIQQKLMEYPGTRMAVDAVAGSAGMVGDVGSFLGWHGANQTKQNLLQRIESNLDVSQANIWENGEQDKGNGVDWLAKNLAPMIPAVLATGGTSLLARTLGLSGAAAKVLSGLTVGAMFDTQQAGKTYTAVAGSGGSDYAARLAANRVAAIGALPNALFGATDVLPLLRDNPLLTSLGLGGATGAAGQLGQNVATGQPWQKGLAPAAVQGAAMMGGMHIGMGAFGGSMSDAVDAAEQSKLRERSPEKFNEAMQSIFAGDQSLRIPVDQFNGYFKGKGADPSTVASALGSANYAAAHLSGGEVEIPPAEYLSKLEPEDQKALLQHIVDPSTGLTGRQHQEGLAELEQWATGGGAQKLAEDAAAADAETAATPEYQAVKEDLRQRYTDAGETPLAAETTAAAGARDIGNLAANFQMKPTEVLAMFNPKVVRGEAPEGQRNVVPSPSISASEASGSVPEREAGNQSSPAQKGSATAPEQATPVTIARQLVKAGHPYWDSTSDAFATNAAIQTELQKTGLPSGRKTAAFKAVKDEIARIGSERKAGYEARRRASPEYRAAAEEARRLHDDAWDEMSPDEQTEATEGEYRRAQNESEAEQKKQEESEEWERELHRRVAYMDAKQAQVEELLDKQGVKYASRGSSTYSRYLTIEQPDGGTAKIRISDHEPPTGVRGGYVGGYNEATGERYDAPDLSLHPGDDAIDKVRDLIGAATPDEMRPYDVARVPLDQLHLDPKRFQYKMNTDAGGVTNLLKGQAWNEDNAGVISVWRDPDDGKTYVVNGHHRYQLAKETGQSDVAVRMIGADNAAEARAKGARQNIAEGRGTAMDAAKFFRDSNYSQADLKGLGISMGEATAANGVALARLHPGLFDQVVNGKVAEGRAVAIGNATGDPEEQEAILKLIDKAESKGKHVTNETVNELARMVKGAGQHAETQNTLFGAQETTHSLALEKAEVSSYIRKTIGEEQRTFAGVADEKRAAQLGGVEGQTINAAKNGEIAGDAAIAKEMYDRLSVRSGTVDEILNRAAREIAEGKKPNDVKAKAYADTRDALREALAGADSVRGGMGGENEGRPAGGKPGSADASTASDVLSLFQTRGEDQQPRGWIRILPDGSVEVGKTKIGNESTDLHELLGHGYLISLNRLFKAHGDLASETVKADRQTILDFLGAKDLDSLTREQHERFADATLQYLREGKVPNPELRGVFQRIAVWLQSIFKKASDLGAEISPELRGVMDRRFAADNALNRAETEAGPKLFASPEEAGWTEEQFQKYAADNNMSAEQARADLVGRLNEAAVRARSESWREEERNVREAVTAQVDQRPDYSAIRSLRRGTLDDGTELALGREDLVKQFGEDRVKALQAQHRGLYRNEGGEDPEIVAEVFGFNSAAEMLKAIETAPRRSAAIETATREYMTAKHGDIRYDGTLDDQARIALENDNRAEGLHAELIALKQKIAGMAGQRDALRAIEVAPIASYREAAQQMVEKKSPADLQPTRYLDASRRYSREAFEALQKGDAQAAAEAKHKELMNHFLFREASAARDYLENKFEPYVKRTLKPAAQSKLGLAGGDYRDQVNWILARYALGPQVARPERSLGEWAASKYDQGKEPAIDPAILDESRTINYRNAPISEIRRVHDALVNVRKLASLELGMEVNGKRIEFSAAVANMDAQARETLPSKPTRVLKGNATLGERFADYAERGDALLMRTERLMEWWDGGKSGPWHENLWNLAADAQGNEYKLQEQVTKALGDALERIPKEQRAKMLDKVSVDGIPETVTRHDLISMAFNMGNEGNLDRLTKTFIAHGWDPDAIERIKGMLTRDEWQFVQDGWDSLKPLGKAQSELERRLTGLPPVMVTPTPLRLGLRDGTMDVAGGYYPVVMDPRYSARGAQQDAGTSAQNLMEAGYGRAATSRGNMKARTGFGGPLLLDYEQVLTQHTAKVIKDITHREFMLVANKLLLDPQLRLAMRETLGEGYEEKMMPWLRTIVNDRNGSAVQGLSDFSRALRALRTNLTLATLSYKISTSLLQWTHAPRMLLSANPGSYAQAMVDFLAHPAEMTQQIKDLSPNEMASRGDNLDRDIRAALKGDPGIQRSMARVGNVSIKYTDHILSFPLWLSVYRDALKEHVGLTEDKAQNLAMHAADSAVRLGLGSGAPKDLPPIMRGNDGAKLITMFYSFHNGIYGQVRDIGHQFRQTHNVAKLSYGLALSVLAPALLGALVSGNGPKDGENKGLWAAKRALLFSADTVPLLRDAASALDSDGEIKNPLFNMASKATKATQEMMSESDDKDWRGVGLSYLEVAGDLAGVPGTTQAMKPMRYMNQVQKGNVDNPNVWDAVAGSARH
jgi:hypothetical protein